MKLPMLVAGTVMLVLASGTLARSDPPSGDTTTLPNANQTPEAPANGTMPNANGTLPQSGTINPDGTANGPASTPVVAPPVPDCLPGAANACAPNSGCQPAQPAAPLGNNCPPPVLPNGR